MTRVFRQDHYFSTRLPYVNKKIGEMSSSMVKIKYNTTKDMNNKLQLLKGKTKLKFYQNTSNYYVEMIYTRQNGKFQLEEDFFQ